MAGRKKCATREKHALIQGLPPAIRQQKTLGGNLGRSRAWVRKNTPAFSNLASENTRPEKKWWPTLMRDQINIFL